MRIAPLFASLFALMVFAAAALPGASHAASHASGGDKYVGYYYPPITSEETFSRVLTRAPNARASVRTNFVTTITKAQLEAPESPRFVFFEKGADSETLVLIALDDEVFSTLFRARAVLAQITSNLRGTKFFIDQNLNIEGTFYDMLQIMSFKTMIISDGRNWSHRVTFTKE